MLERFPVKCTQVQWREVSPARLAAYIEVREYRVGCDDKANEFEGA
jgi:hypothetical protein